MTAAGVYKWCTVAQQDALHEDGVCRFCEPKSWEPLPRKCLLCGTEFAPLVSGNQEKRYCSRRCQHRAWERKQSASWRAEQTRRQNERRAYMRSLGVRRVA